MRLVCAAILAFFALGITLSAQTEGKKTTRLIQPGDITKTMDAFIMSDKKDVLAKQILIPVFRATEIVMVRQMPNASTLAGEMAQALYTIYDYPDNKELLHIAARAFLSRPDLFHSSFESIRQDERARAVAAIVTGWGELKEDLEKNPQTSSTTKVRMTALNNIVNAWKCKYPEYVPKRWL